MTVAEYAERWLIRRRIEARGAAVEECRLRKWILPALGAMPLAELRPRHVREFVLTVRACGTLAPRSVRSLATIGAALFRDAVADELIAASPWALRRTDLPPAVDKDPRWRLSAVYSREEIEALISDVRLPVERRLLYAIKALAGLRHGEATALAWRDYERDPLPLGRLFVARSKTDTPRVIPVHPTLAAMLAEWKMTTWPARYERVPTLDDLIVPSLAGTPLERNNACHRLRGDLETIGFRRRRGHDLRRSFISLCLAAGARREVLRAITHGRRDVMDQYTEYPWPLLCEQVSGLSIERRGGGRVLALAKRDEAG